MSMKTEVAGVAALGCVLMDLEHPQGGAPRVSLVSAQA